MVKHVKLMDKYDAEIVEERYNSLIGRLELEVKVTHLGEGTPSRGIIREGLARLYGKRIEQVYIRKVQTEYGLPVSSVEVHIYDDVERAKYFEPEYVIKRDEESYSKVSRSSG